MSSSPIGRPLKIKNPNICLLLLLLLTILATPLWFLAFTCTINETSLCYVTFTGGEAQFDPGRSNKVDYSFDINRIKDLKFHMDHFDAAKQSFRNIPIAPDGVEHRYSNESFGFLPLNTTFPNLAKGVIDDIYEARFLNYYRMAHFALAHRADVAILPPGPYYPEPSIIIALRPLRSNPMDAMLASSPLDIYGAADNLTAAESSSEGWFLRLLDFYRHLSEQTWLAKDVYITIHPSVYKTGEQMRLAMGTRHFLAWYLENDDSVSTENGPRVLRKYGDSKTRPHPLERSGIARVAFCLEEPERTSTNPKLHLSYEPVEMISGSMPLAIKSVKVFAEKRIPFHINRMWDAVTESLLGEPRDRPSTPFLERKMEALTFRIQGRWKKKDVWAAISGVMELHFRALNGLVRDLYWWFKVYFLAGADHVTQIGDTWSRFVNPGVSYGMACGLAVVCVGPDFQYYRYPGQPFGSLEGTGGFRKLLPYRGFINRLEYALAAAAMGILTFAIGLFPSVYIYNQTVDAGSEHCLLPKLDVFLSKSNRILNIGALSTSATSMLLCIAAAVMFSESKSTAVMRTMKRPKFFLNELYRWQKVCLVGLRYAGALTFVGVMITNAPLMHLLGIYVSSLAFFSRLLNGGMTANLIWRALIPVFMVLFSLICYYDESAQVLARNFPSFEPYVNSNLRQWMKTPVFFFRRILAEALINNICLNYASFPAALATGTYMFTITVMSLATFLTGAYLRLTGMFLGSTIDNYEFYSEKKELKEE